MPGLGTRPGNSLISAFYYAVINVYFKVSGKLALTKRRAELLGYSKGSKEATFIQGHLIKDIQNLPLMTTFMTIRTLCASRMRCVRSTTSEMTFESSR